MSAAREIRAGAVAAAERLSRDTWDARGSRGEVRATAADMVAAGHAARSARARAEVDAWTERTAQILPTVADDPRVLALARRMLRRAYGAPVGATWNVDALRSLVDLVADAADVTGWQDRAAAVLPVVESPTGSDEGTWAMLIDDGSGADTPGTIRDAVGHTARGWTPAERADAARRIALVRAADDLLRDAGTPVPLIGTLTTSWEETFAPTRERAGLPHDVDPVQVVRRNMGRSVVHDGRVHGTRKDRTRSAYPAATGRTGGRRVKVRTRDGREISVPRPVVTWGPFAGYATVVSRGAVSEDRRRRLSLVGILPRVPALPAHAWTGYNACAAAHLVASWPTGRPARGKDPRATRPTRARPTVARDEHALARLVADAIASDGTTVLALGDDKRGPRVTITRTGRSIRATIGRGKVRRSWTARRGTENVSAVRARVLADVRTHVHAATAVATIQAAARIA